MIHIKPTLSVKEFVSERAYRRAMIAAHEAMGLEWHTKMLPEHFKREAAQKYNYKQRSAKYKSWKKKRWQSRRPLRNGQYVEGSGETDNVLTGDMRDMLTRASTIRAFPTRTTVAMTGPRYMTMRVFEGNRQAAVRAGWTYGKGQKFNASAGQQPNKVEEVTTTSRAEREQLAKVADVVLERAAAGW